MLFSVELFNLILYCAQQLGIALGLGAQTIMLVAYINAMRDGTIDEEEAQFLRATRRTLWVSLVLILVSGVGITILHILAGQAATVMSPAYLFKSALIAGVVVLTALLHTLPETFAEGLLGGTWYALFLVHILAPVTTWMNLLTLYAVWLIGFNLIWYVVVFSTRERVHPPPVGKKSSEALALHNLAPKPPRKPFFSFSFLHRHPTEEVPAVPIMPPVVAAPIAPSPPQHYQEIKLDPVPRTQPIIVPQALAPVEVKAPLVPQMPPVQIKIDPAPILVRQAPPVERLPGTIATDTPFLPQVPPLQPIPTTLPVPGTPSMPAPTSIAPVAPAQPAPAVSPEIKLGLNVMPKSPEQLKS